MLVEDALGRTIRADDPILSSEQERIDLAASVVGDVVLMLGTLLDEEFDHDIPNATLAAVGSTASDDVEFFTAVVASADDRIASNEIPDWLRKAADDVSGRQRLRDRFVGRTYARAHGAIESDGEQDQSPDSVFDEAQFHRSDPTTRLYRAGLQGVVDYEASVAGALFHGVWAQHETVSDPICQRALAAGVGYAAHLELSGASATEEQDEILNTVEQHRDDLSEPSEALLNVLIEDDPDIENVAAGIDTEADEHDLSELEALAYRQFISDITNPPGPSGYYSTAS
ncbi:hypothetical protein C5C07_19140 [Haloferax sp. Atlit-4N]|uniref:hypothetical protein n=1 Tax=Haloferax sp. Atlit-4N TaxID=2077206 RepID=UPI000E24CF32|nr:hypothetical protein [Haloferax sp. Atlit-4N]RDZ50439.1 hypothetical protein C5C07_19140 [Haloferax sp. Atlit-4N]